MRQGTMTARTKGRGEGRGELGGRCGCRLEPVYILNVTLSSVGTSPPPLLSHSRTPSSGCTLDLCRHFTEVTLTPGSHPQLVLLTSLPRW